MAITIKFLIFIQFVLIKLSTSDASAFMRRLNRDLLASYDKDLIPQDKRDDPLSVAIGLSLINIEGADRATNTVDVVAYHYVDWKDNALRWDPGKYGGISKMRIPASKLWIPDLTIYNLVDELKLLSPEIAVVTSEGNVKLVKNIRFKFRCDLTFVGLGSNCSIKIGSWTYSGYHMTLKEPTLDSFDLLSYSDASMFHIQYAEAEKDVKVYECCPEPYEHIQFVFSFLKYRFGYFSKAFYEN